MFTIVAPKILAKATDELTAGLMRIITGAAEGIDRLYRESFTVFRLYALSALFSYIQDLRCPAFHKVSANMRRAIMEKIGSFARLVFSQNESG